MSMEMLHEFGKVAANRREGGKNYGVVVLRQGIVEFMPDVKTLSSELNETMAGEEGSSYEDWLDALFRNLKTLLGSMLDKFGSQLILERNLHSNMQVAKIEAGRQVFGIVQPVLKNYKAIGCYKGKLSAQPRYRFYEGRCALTIIFNANYCNGFWHVVGTLIDSANMRYIVTSSGSTKEAEKWEPARFRFTVMMNFERRDGKNVAVIKNMLVEFDRSAFEMFKSLHESWKRFEEYREPELSAIGQERMR